ncbi:hypothetical protein N7528_002774 [Penicillium herquei]|nr:hypothetical protein N7528_002774 [Penicillium herquei]
MSFQQRSQLNRFRSHGRCLRQRMQSTLSSYWIDPDSTPNYFHACSDAYTYNILTDDFDPDDVFPEILTLKHQLSRPEI